ncbi:restriction endonuclease subunit S [Streptococcus parauberis]|uniref:restriction endonuclease subunit S n=1 Tax=Streptococcus parauberis TaxID=1348 RepID=UPI000E300A1D|nr:restriction endonuclease subunit S [Streptococcus parauberis]RFE01341.1 EcoKI restriction-modification system protein HsdS [Streptococcus parauberis]
MKYKAFLLEELTNAIFSGGTPSKSIKEYWNGDINWLSSGETRNNFIYQTANKITSLGVEKSSTRKAQKGDVVIASAGQGKTRGQVSFLKIDTFINQSIIAIEVNNNLLDEKYLFYNLKSRYRELRSISDSASVRGSLTTKMLKELKIDIPSLKYQKKISKILYTLDSKIEVNNKIINNLEQQAQAIFKSWFIDFEPFQDGEFVDSELGPIPKEWEVKKIGEVTECLLGGTPDRKNKLFWNGNIGWINSGEVNKKRIIHPTEFITEMGLRKSATKLLPKKTTVLAITGATLGQVSLLEINCCANQSVIGILENENLKYEYIYLFVKNNINKIIANQTGGAQQHINSNDVKMTDIIIPTNLIMSKYYSVIHPLLEQIATLFFQNQKLAETRDLLLPKLMSGELDVSDLDI